MEPRLFRYIWMHTRREQIFIVLLIVISMIPFYLAFDLPKRIVNGPLLGQGFDQPEATQPFLDVAINLPLWGEVQILPGWQLERLPLLMALSFTFLALVIINGIFKLVINTLKGQMGERLLRRIRYDLVDRVLRFPTARFRQVKAGEVASMVKDEIEPLGGFAGDAFTQPAFLGGQALTALFFIFMQHFWLGMVAAFMAMVQVAIIPRMRRRLIRLGRERQITARELAGRVAEIVDGIQTIHTYDTTNYERADIATRLGRIFRIRYDIYQWKFLVKFLNNFLAQMTPFLFYSIGGYLTIRGHLDVGQLVAVINAYKELPGPMKELIDWDLARQDMQVKYEQVVEQFEGENLIDPARHAIDARGPEGPLTPLVLQGVTVSGETGATLLSDISLEIAPGERVAVIGGSAGGGPVLGELLGGLVRPTAGTLSLGGHGMDDLPESVTGRAIGYAGAGGYYFSGSLLDNLTYGLKRRPGAADRRTPDTGRYGRSWQRREAKRAGNPDFDLATDWIDYEAVQPLPGEDGFLGSVCTVLDVVGLSEDTIGFALRNRIDIDKMPDAAERVLEMRHGLRAELARRNLSNLVLPFEPDRYNPEATVGENLFFGVPRDHDTTLKRILKHPYFRQALTASGLASVLFRLGRDFAAATVEIFEGLEQNPEMLQWLTYMSAEELPEYEQLLARTERGGYATARPADRERLIRLAFSYVEPRYRFGLLTDTLRARLVEGRTLLHREMPEDLKRQVQRYDPDEYLVGATLLENVLFGKLNRRFGNAEDRLRAVTREMFRERPELRRQVMSIGLEHDIGAAGRRLSALQRQKLGLARMLVRRSVYYVLNEPLAGSDARLQAGLIESILDFLAHRRQPPAVIWILANESLARAFDRTVEISGGRLVQDSARTNIGVDDAPQRLHAHP